MRKKFNKNKEKGLGEIYLDCFNFLKSSKSYILLTISLFILFVLLGYLFQMPSNLETKFLEMLKQIAERFNGLNVYQTVWLIFSNNLTVSFLVLVLGSILGIFTIATLISNGLIIGYVARKAVSLNGIIVLWKLFPHGIFELPAVLISMALGIKLGFQLFKKGAFKFNLKNSLYTFFLIVVPLLAIAAIIEGLLVFFIK
ncbi:Stage II sporulation protein M [uncultured archaeon]|nr:Stage II sporulation protein M [uncultured archaeon]